MILKLINNEEITVYRQNCGFQEGRDLQASRMWNTNPIQLIQAGEGYFIIGKYGTIAGDHCDMMIPVRNVLYITEADVWETPIPDDIKWDKFKGDYRKIFYDIKLYSGEVIEQCWPNAGTFHAMVDKSMTKYCNVQYFKPTEMKDENYGA